MLGHNNFNEANIGYTALLLVGAVASQQSKILAIMLLASSLDSTPDLAAPLMAWLTRHDM